ncbi:MAG: 7-cyano-7-deazaguanine synthase QueC [Deltaproteobacteria bacterium RIFCSPLOWO2_02_FULL_46_8]|nr:MAG: 7-cyano-7-deazaguanine synthase QueC [Deltaproteobacteria bacterium RIFCSPLOWO2_02_FULL_46_8]
MERAVTLLSGGLDSFLSTSLAKKECDTVLGLTFDYGQKAVKQEIKAAQKMAKEWRIKHQIVDLPWLKTLGHSALTSAQTLLPRFHGSEKLSDKKTTEKSAEAVWVPNRNGVFLNIAGAFAESLGATVIITGFNREEAATFPDNGSEFVHRINRALELSTFLYPPKVKSYVQSLTKTEMVEKLLSLDLPLDNFWSCYEGEEKMCGTCESCARSITAFKANNFLEKIRHRFIQVS